MSSYTYTSPADETRTTEAGIVVRRSRILSTPFVVYQAWEPRTSSASHSTISTIDGKWYGAIATRCDDSSYRHLAGGSPERIAAVERHYAANYAAAHAAIIAAFPEAAEGKRTGGDIEICFA